ncbi:MAG: DUF2202 domain-containing protein [Magnetococcales bacterium]|nr:DUF2202 domain-containing protein [Magnetococcales bacterium]
MKDKLQDYDVIEIHEDKPTRQSRPSSCHRHPDQGQKLLIGATIAVAIIALALSFLDIQKDDSKAPAPNVIIPTTMLQPVAMPMANQVTPPSETDKTHLLYMREEEKLARDVYQQLFQHWKLTLFSSIARAEQRHMNAVGQLITRFSLPDPVGTNGIGVFQHQKLATLYSDLMARGKRSITEALRVGALIEEIDILDLEAGLKTTNQPDIQRVFRNIQRGSTNHLRTFAHGLELRGEIYQPIKLTKDSFNAILHSPTDTGFFANGQ